MDGAATSGLAGVMDYGTGAGNTITHVYGGTVDKPRKKMEGNKMSCKKKPKPKPSK